MRVFLPRGPGLVLAAAFALGVASCATLFTAAPKNLYRVTPDSTFPSALPHVSAQLLVDVPVAPTALDTDRIALSRSAVSLDYFADSQWTDRAPVVVQTALLESFENSGAIVAIDRESPELRADFVLKVEIRHFEAIYDSPDKPPQIWVTLNVRLVKMPDREIIAQKSVTAQEPASAGDIPHIVLAFDAALGEVMKQIVVWTVSNPALQRPALPEKSR